MKLPSTPQDFGRVWHTFLSFWNFERSSLLISILISIFVLVVSAWGAFISRRNAKAAERSAKAAEQQANAALDPGLPLPGPVITTGRMFTWPKPRRPPSASESTATITGCVLAPPMSTSGRSVWPWKCWTAPRLYKRAERFTLPRSAPRERVGHHWIDLARGYLAARRLPAGPRYPSTGPADRTAADPSTLRSTRRSVPSPGPTGAAPIPSPTSSAGSASPPSVSPVETPFAAQFAMPSWSNLPAAPPSVADTHRHHCANRTVHRT
jgi:hypothetical protein